MYNWSVDEEKLKSDERKYTIWKLEQLVNFGLNDEKIDEQSLKKHWSELNLDPARRRFLEFILYGHGTTNFHQNTASHSETHSRR